jgi:hypothetical protein
LHSLSEEQDCPQVFFGIPPPPPPPPPPQEALSMQATSPELQFPPQ